MRWVLAALLCFALALVLFLRPQTASKREPSRRHHHHHAHSHKPRVAVSDTSSFKLPQQTEGVWVEGVVLLPSGKPAPFAKMTVTTADGHSFSFTTNLDGRFRFHLLRREHITITARAKGHITARISLTPGEEPLKIAVPEHARVTVEVVEATGKTPVSGARVVAVTRHSGKVLATATETPVPGIYLFPSLKVGYYGLYVEAEGFWPARKLLRVTEAVNHVKVTLQAGAWVHGVVVDESGAPVADVRLLAGRTGRKHVAERPDVTSRTDKNGNFSLFLPGEEIYIYAEKEGYAPAAIEGIPLHPGQVLSGVELVLRRGAVISGSVLDENSAPVEGATVKVSAMLFHSLHPVLYHSTKTDKNGNFNFKNLPEADYWLEVTHPDFVPYKHPEMLHLKGTPSLTGIVVQLRRGLSITGTVLDESGGPVADARVRVRRLRGPEDDPDVPQPEWSTKSDSEGRFRVAGLLEGRYRVTVRSDRHGSATKTVTAPCQNLIFRLASRADIVGWVLREGRPVADVEVLARRNSLIFVTKTDQNGHFRLKDLVTGEWRIAIRVSDRIIKERTIQLVPPETSITLTMP